jgi:arylsulfatase A
MKRFLVLLLATFIIAQFLSAQTDKPNILLFLIDDMGWKDLGCYGGGFIETPVADKLAVDGIRFNNAYASPVCSPTRASLISGQNAARTGIWEVIGVNDRPYAKMKSPPKSEQINEGIMTYADILNKEGYVSGLVGKWHVGRTPQQHGFSAIDEKIYDAKLQEYANENEHHKVGEITANAIEFMRENKTKPFVICVSHTAVHAPLLAREDLIRKYKTKLRKTGIDDVHPTYAAMTEMVDESLGMLLHELKVLGLTKNTVVFLYSDNGGLIYDMYLGKPEPMATTIAPLRDQKGSLYEGGIRVPLIVKWPGKVKPNSVSNELVNSYDLFSTFVDIGGGKIPATQQTDGISLVPIVKGEKASLNRKALYWHFPTSQWTRNPMGAMRKGNYKLIEHYDDGSLELFDLIDDIGETINLVNKKPEKAEELLNDLKSWRTSLGVQMPASNPDYDPIREKELGTTNFLKSKQN